jgi:hypothetical protein
MVSPSPRPGTPARGQIDGLGVNWTVYQEKGQVLQRRRFRGGTKTFLDKESGSRAAGWSQLVWIYLQTVDTRHALGSPNVDVDPPSEGEDQPSRLVSHTAAQHG